MLVAEGGSIAGIAATGRVLNEEIRTTRDIYREQSERIRVLLTEDPNRLLALDTVLGWRYRAGRHDSTNGSNAWGVRGTRVYAPQPRPGVTRVAAFGDSFVYANEVRDADSWGAQLEAVDPRIEVLNYGVGGYGLDQAYLRYLAEGAAHGSHVALMGFAPDDLGRLVNVYRRFRSNREIPLFKPRFELQPDGSLALRPTPVPDRTSYEALLASPASVVRYGEHDQWFEPAVYRNPLHDYSATVRLGANLLARVHRRYLRADRLLDGSVYNRRAPAFAIQARLFELFVDSARARGVRPLVLLLPDRASVAQQRAGRAPVYAPLRDTLAALGIPHLDALDAFGAASAAAPSSWFAPGGHYSPEGNRVVAMWLAGRLGAATGR